MASLLRRVVAAAFACLLVGSEAPAWAKGGPEQLDQIEPEKGEWQLEYYGAFGGNGEHVVEALVAVSDWLVLGAEVEMEGPRDGLELESVALVTLVRLVDPNEGPVGLGVEFQAAIDRAGNLSELEGRVIAETRTPKWWVQADLILRQVRDHGQRGTGLAYATSLQHSLGEDFWLGVEASGQLVALSGEDEVAPEGQHYLGPSLTIERPIGGDNEVEFGLAWLQRVRGRGPGSGPRVFAQFTF